MWESGELGLGPTSQCVGSPRCGSLDLGGHVPSSLLPQGHRAETSRWPGSARSAGGGKACAPALQMGKLRPGEGELFVTMGRGGTDPVGWPWAASPPPGEPTAVGLHLPKPSHGPWPTWVPRSLWAGVPAVTISCFVGQAYRGGDEARSSEDAGRPRGRCPRSHFAEEGAEARPRVRSPSRAQPLQPGPQNHDLPLTPTMVLGRSLSWAGGGS